MGAGIILLGAYGKIDMYLTYKPEITFFKIVYRRHTYFSQEFIDQYFSVSPNFGTKTSCVLFNNADLISDLYLNIKLPPVTKYLNYPSSPEVDSLFAFRWIDYIGFSIIKNIEIQFGGKTIQKINNDWLYIWFNTTGFRNPLRDKGSHERGIKRLVGQYSGVTNYQNQKDSISLTVPIPFWFTKNYGCALPLNCINFSEVKVNLELDNLSDLISYGPTHVIRVAESVCPFTLYEYIYQGDSIGIFFGFVSETKNMYFNSLSGKFVKCNNSIESECVSVVTRSSSLLILNSARKFMLPTSDAVETNISFQPNVNIISCNLSANYIFLENEERKRFYSSTHEYLVDQIQYYTNSKLVSINNNVLLNFVNPVLELYWTVQLNSILKNLDIYNYSDKIDNGKSLIQQVSISLNGYDVFSKREFTFTESISMFECHPHCIKNIGLHNYSFGIKPDVAQPSGSCNFSRIEKTFLQFTLTPVVNYENSATLKVYARSYNILRIVNGIVEILF